MSQMVLLEWEGPVAFVTLNRPERHNSLVPALLGQMLDVLTQIEDHPTVRVVVLRANGRSFSTGGDLQGFYDHRENLEAYSRQIVGLLNQVILALMALPVPVVAAVHGIVTGGSLGLVLAADVVLVAPEASFAPYYSVVGFSPDGGWTAMLPRLIGARRAAAILLHNDAIDAETAVAWGVAHRIVPADQLAEETMAVAGDLAAKKRGSLRHTKQLLYGLDGDLTERLEAERTHFISQILTEEALEGMTAFLQE